MAVSGMWMRRNLAVNPQWAPWVVSSNRHRNEDEVPAQIREGFIQAPPYQPTGGQVPDYTGHTDPGNIPAHEPRSHQGVRRNPSMTAADRAAVRSQNFGMATRLNQADGPFRFWDDKWEIPLTQDEPGTQAARGAGGRPDLVRGLNAFPENNPPKRMYNGHGWRLSWWQKTWFSHNLKPQRRRHGLQVISLKAAAPRPSVGGTRKSIYDGTSWPSLARSRTRNLSTPRMRRQPGFIDEAVMEDRWPGSQASVVDVM